jgi:hypothetical protein
MRILTVTASVTLNDIECYGTKILCNASAAITLSFPASATSKNESDSEVDNLSAFDVTIGSQTISQYGHGHIVNVGGASWECVIGGGGGQSASFTSIVVSGQNTILATTASDALEFIASTGMVITTNTANKTVTFATSLSAHEMVTMWEPMVNGDSVNPEVMFDVSGDIIMVEVAV